MIKAALLLFVAACVIPRLRHRSAAERHLLWATTLAAATLLPVVARLLPEWQPGWMSGMMAVLPSSFDPARTARRRRTRFAGRVLRRMK